MKVFYHISHKIRPKISTDDIIYEVTRQYHSIIWSNKLITARTKKKLINNWLIEKTGSRTHQFNDKLTRSMVRTDSIA